MRVSREAAALLLGILISLVSAPGGALAQNSPKQSPTVVAVVDVAHIFRNHPGIKRQVEQIDQTLKSYEGALGAKRDELKQISEQLKQYKVGSAEYARAEETLASKESALRLEATRKRKELADAEAKIYYDNYQHITDAVQRICDYNGIDLVLRYNREEMDLEKPDSVLRGVTRDVVYHSNRLDITKFVMQLLDDKLGSQQRVASPSAAPSNR